jgi:hypothetical protein
MEIIHARRSTRPSRYAPFRIRRFRRRAHGTKRYSSNFLQRQTVYCFNNERHAIQDDFHPGRENDPSAQWKGWQEKLGTWKLDTSGFCTSWKGAETNCYTVVPSGRNKWSIQKGSTAVAVWSK